MDNSIPDNLWPSLICPQCADRLQKSGTGLECESCGTAYPTTSSGAPDLRLQRPKKLTWQMDVGTALLPEQGFEFDVLKPNPHPGVDFSGIAVPHHLSPELLSYFPRAKDTSSLMLDLGCGDAIHRGVCEHAGFRYVGIDYDAKTAPMLADAHALPFADETFEFVLSVAVLEHIRFPQLMTREACRVLKPGGVFLGTVAFLEPFHQNSFYHHTHLGTYNSLQDGGFHVERICPSASWSVLKAQATMGLFPRMPRALSHSLVAPLQLLHRGWWALARTVNRKATNEVRVTNTTGAFAFIATRMAVSQG